MDELFIEMVSMVIAAFGALITGIGAFIYTVYNMGFILIWIGLIMLSVGIYTHIFSYFYYDYWKRWRNSHG